MSGSLLSFSGRALDDHGSFHIRWSESGALPNITGSFFNTQENETALDKNPYGAFYRSAQSGNGVDGVRGWFERLNFDAKRCSTLYVDGMNEVRVNGVYVLYCIYAGARGEKYTDVVA